MYIASAKPSYEEIKKYNYKMIDIVEPSFNFNIKDYLEIFKNVIENIDIDKAPIFGVGGTGFYIDSIKYTTCSRCFLLSLRNFFTAL